MFMPNPNPRFEWEALKMVLELAAEYLPKIAEAFYVLAKALGAIEDKESPEELGNKALQAEDQGLYPENYEDYQEYFQALDSFQPDENLSGEISVEEKLEKGIEILVMALQVKYPETDFMKLLEAVKISEENKEIFTLEHFTEFAKLAAEDEEFLNNFGKLLHGEEMDTADYLKIVSNLVEIEKKLRPDISETDAENYIKSLG